MIFLIYVHNSKTIYIKKTEGVLTKEKLNYIFTVVKKKRITYLILPSICMIAVRLLTFFLVILQF